VRIQQFIMIHGKIVGVFSSL